MPCPVGSGDLEDAGTVAWQGNGSAQARLTGLQMRITEPGLDGISHPAFRLIARVFRPVRSRRQPFPGGIVENHVIIMRRQAETDSAVRADRLLAQAQTSSRQWEMKQTDLEIGSRLGGGAHPRT